VLVAGPGCGSNGRVVPVTRSTAIVGRRAELAAARGMVDALDRASGGTLLVAGEAGIGKSRLLAEVAARAGERGWPVLRGHAVPGGGTYRPLAEALARPLRELPLAGSARLRPFRAALQRVVPGWSEPGGDDAGDADAADGDAAVVGGPVPDPAVVLGEGVLAVLREIGGPSVLVLEDLHWADAETLGVLAYLAGVVPGTSVLLALSTRDEVAVAGLTVLAARPGITHLKLRRLDAADVGALAAACRAGEPLPEAELQRLVERSEGLPFLVEELLDPSGGAVPPTLSGLVAGRLAELPETGRAVLTAAAVMGTDLDWRALAAVTGQSEDAVLAALRTAAELGLVAAGSPGDTRGGAQLRWRHALTRDAVLAGLLPPERAALAARAARVLAARAEPGDRAGAARLYGDAGEWDRAVAVLLGLARRDIARGALHSAEELLERAAGTGRAPGAVAAERVRVLTLLGRVAEALDVGAAALEAAEVRGDEHAELCLRLARAAVAGGRWAEAESWLERAGRHHDPRSLALGADAAYGAGTVGRAAALAGAAVEAVDAEPGRPEHAATLCEALMVLARSRVGPDLSTAQALYRRAAQVAAEHGLAPWRVEALFGLGSIQYSAGDPSAPVLAQARELALQHGMLARVLQADLLRSEGLMCVEGPRAGVVLARLTAQRAGRLRLSGLQAMVETTCAAQAAWIGDTETMNGMLAAAATRRDASVEVATLAPMVRGIPHLLAHDLRRACALFDGGFTELLGHRAAAPIAYFGLWALLRTAVGDRDAELRETLRHHHCAAALANRAALDYGDAIAAGRAGDRAAAAARFAAADAALSGVPWWNRMLRLVVLETAVADGWGDPVPALRADLAAHEQAGDHAMARTCRDLLRVAGAPTRRGRGTSAVPPALRSLGITSREADVLALVAEGRTNAQIAAHLFLSPRTVETHVARLLAKTRAAGRAELREWVRRQ
jgi:DNA-binding CsgD family transcriptional regulator/tetratricopeptide (TPR) repeat protein